MNFLGAACAIRDLERARRYLADPLVALRRSGRAKNFQCGPVLVAEHPPHIVTALDQFYDGKPDPRTLVLLGSQLSRG